MKKNTLINTAVIMSAAIFAAGELQADSFRFGIGVTPRGTSLSVGYGDRECHPKPRGPKVRHAPQPVRVVHRRPVGHYEDRVERVWVDGYWTQRVHRNGRPVRVWNPGYWTERVVRLWVRH